MELTKELREMYIQTAEKLSGSERRIFMAQVTRILGRGGQRKAERLLGWNRGTIRKGLYELENGPIEDRFSARGRKAAEYHLPNLLTDIDQILEQDEGGYSAAEVRRLLLVNFDYDDSNLPSTETIRKKVKLVRS